jgi:hypothetical protein
LGLVRAWQILAVILVDDAEIDAVIVIPACPGNGPAVEESAVEIEAAVGILGAGLDELRTDEPAIGGAVQESALGLGDAGDEEFSRIVGILDRHRDAVARAPIGRGDPGKAALDRDRIFVEIGLASGRGGRSRVRSAMGEYDESAVPILRHRRQEIGPGLLLGRVAGRDRGNRFRTGRDVGKRGLRGLLRRRRRARHHQCEKSEACRFDVGRTIPHAFLPALNWVRCDASMGD